MLGMLEVKELMNVAAVHEPGYVVNPRLLCGKSKLNTREVRIEKVLPDLNSLLVLDENGKFSPLSEQEKTDLIIKIFNDFWKHHMNFKPKGFEFIGLSDDFFCDTSYYRLEEYSKVFFDRRMDDEIANRNNFKYRLSTATELKNLRFFQESFNRGLKKEKTKVSRARAKYRKEQGGEIRQLLMFLVANHLARKDEGEDLSRTLEFNMAQ